MHFDENGIVQYVLWGSGFYHCSFIYLFLECVFLYCIGFCSTTCKVKWFFFLNYRLFWSWRRGWCSDCEARTRRECCVSGRRDGWGGLKQQKNLCIYCKCCLIVFLFLNKSNCCKCWGLHSCLVMFGNVLILICAYIFLKLLGFQIKVIFVMC